MYGKTAKHYEQHFSVLLNSYEKEEIAADFLKKFSGNICDFSHTERIWFLEALLKILKDVYGEDTTLENVQHLYKFCEVHFVR